VTAEEPTTDGTGGSWAVVHHEVPRYELRVKGQLGPKWAAWFEGLSLESGEDGTTVIRGEVVDQAALHGLLQRVRDIGIPLLSLTQLAPDAPSAPRAPRTDEGT
jgi:hypothetical protein